MIYLSEIKRNFHLGKNKEEERPIIQRVALHAYEIAFRDYSKGESDIISVKAEYPKDFAVLVKQLRKYL